MFAKEKINMFYSKCENYNVEGFIRCILRGEDLEGLLVFSDSSGGGKDI